MSLQPIAIELCQGSTLRGRRRSSIRPQNLLPLLFTSGAPANAQNESAVTDEPYPLDYPAVEGPLASPALISPISSAHVSGHSSSFNTSRHHDAVSTHKSIATASPSSTLVSGDSYLEARDAFRPDDSRVKWRLASAFFLYFMNGWGDGVTGTALPYFEAEFNLSYMTSSLLFAGTTCGFSLGTLLVPHFMHFLGRFYLSTTKLSWLPLSPFRIFLSRAPPDKIGYSASQARYLALMFASLLPPTSFIMMGSRSGFPCMFMAYVVVSFGRAILTAPLNMFLSSLPSKPLGYAFGMWGFGAVVSPLIFQVTAAAGIPWTHFYFGSLVLPAINIVFLGMTYMPTPKEFGKDRKIALDAADSRDQRSHSLTPDLDDGVPELTTTSLKIAPANQLRLCLSMPYQWAVSIFVLFYCGSETTTQGLVVQYLLAERSANPNAVGYVTSGFWAGISASRVAWSYFSPRITFTARKYIIQGCLGFALAMHLFIWFINSGVENAFSTSLIGVVYGPLFPASLELANDLLPVEVNMVSMAIISASGSIGSAVFPFITGVVTTHYTMRCWSYITAAQTSILFCAWYLFPTRAPPRVVAH